MVEMPPFDDAFRAQVARAREAERIADRTEPRARSARYDRVGNRIAVELKSGASFTIPVAMVWELEGASPEELEQVEPISGGEGLGWEGLDVHLSVAGLLAEIMGPEMVRTFARAGGRVRGGRKAEAARANGRKGGRPRKKPSPEAAAPPDIEPERREERRPGWVVPPIPRLRAAEPTPEERRAAREEAAARAAEPPPPPETYPQRIRRLRKEMGL